MTNGVVFDVAVDLRPNSKTYGLWQGVTLSSDNCYSFYIPKGFAHGFVVLSEHADFSYKVSSPYSPEHESGIIWNDPNIGISWPISNPILSPKDAALPTLTTKK